MHRIQWGSIEILGDSPVWRLPSLELFEKNETTMTETIDSFGGGV